MSQEVESAVVRDLRTQRMLKAELHGRRFGTIEVVVRNVAPGGVGGMSRQWLPVGEPVEIDLPNIGRMEGRIAWTDGVRFGLAFDAEIDADRVTRDAAAGMDRQFRVMDRFRPASSAKRPAIGLR